MVEVDAAVDAVVVVDLEVNNVMNEDAAMTLRMMRARGPKARSCNLSMFGF